MKKKILSFLTAFAVAAFCLIAPVKSGIGFNVDVDASGVEGLSVEAVSGSNVKALEEGDRFTLRMTVPSIPKPVEGILFLIKYNSDVFDVEDWGSVGTGLPNEEANFVENDEELDGNSYLKYTASSADPTLDLSGGLVLEATIKVKDPEDDRGTHEFELLLTGNEYQCGYTAKPWTDVWKPKANDAKASVKIANTVKGYITGIDLSDLPTGMSAWVVIYDGNTVVGSGKVDDTMGDFEIISGPEDDKKSYDLKIRVGADETSLSPLWGVFTEYEEPFGTDVPVTFVEPKFTNNKLTDKTGTAQIKGSKEIRDIGTLTFRLFGDADNDGKVGASDATAVLRYIVGNPSAIDDVNPDVKTINKGIANVLDTDEVINAKDATQILRKIIGFSSVFDGRG